MSWGVPQLWKGVNWTILIVFGQTPDIQKLRTSLMPYFLFRQLWDSVVSVSVAVRWKYWQSIKIYRTEILKATEWNRFVYVSGTISKVITERVANYTVSFVETPLVMNSLWSIFFTFPIRRLKILGLNRPEKKEECLCTFSAPI